ncbi:hypothetical protein [Dermacoccus nishinomiyaensis]|uniref:hypothetical protein n=1 Tax=Dermacoccus nishinomiyaensis TaxID=1274 RepID=UPI00248F1133|nr:hypothetical protein [Dermacoccus nishinomiyaensis]
MSVPKPRVGRTVTFVPDSDGEPVMAHRWTWVCSCGSLEASPDGLVSHDLAIESAVAHSRTHNAERLAEWFFRCSLHLRKKAGEAASVGDQKCLAGASVAYMKAANTVLQHFVKGES